MTATRVIDKHTELTELDFASAGHTGFASSADLTTTSGTLQTDIDTKLENVVEDIAPELGGDLSCNGYNIENVGRICGSSLSSRVYNNTGSTLIRGTAVTICGLHEEVCTVCVSDNREIGKMPCCGVIESDFVDGDEGCGIRVGRINMDTSGMAGNEKDRLYVQPDGSLDTTIPTSGMVQRVGFLVVKASGNAGRICICIRGPRSMYSAKDQHPIVRMGDDAGHKKVVFKDYTDNEVAALDSDGNLTLSGTVDGLDIANHTHDGRYYTESEVDTISGSLNTKYETATLASSVITDNRLIRGDGGSRGVQESTIIVSDDGEMTNSSQPCFQVNPATNQENLAAGGQYITVLWGSERFDIGNNFASNTFTAPVTGKYQFSINVRLNNMDTAASYYQLRFESSNCLYRVRILQPLFTSDQAYYHLTASLVADMDANDTAYVAIVQSGGAAQTDILTYSYFTGALIC